jgi:predicted PurR-regulated permease PerM
MLTSVPEERLVRFRAATVLAVLGLVIAVVALLEIVLIARQVLTWVLIAVFLTLALNPLVDWFQRHGIRRRGFAAALTFVLALVGLGALGALFIPTLVSEVNGFARELPNYIRDITEGRGPLGRLADRYDIVERVRAEVEEGGASRLLGFSGTALAITKGIITFIVAAVTIAFLTFFMLLEGPAWMDRFYALLPDESRDRWREVGRSIYRTVGGYVTGNLFISIIAGALATIVLLILDVPYAVALGLLVAILDLIPLAGATIAAVVLTAVAAIDGGWVPALIVLAYMVVYQQVENHFIQPVVYSRTVQLSPLAILIAVLVGAKLAGVVGALAAIPVAGTIQVLLLFWLDERRRKRGAEPATV